MLFKKDREKEIKKDMETLKEAVKGISETMYGAEDGIDELLDGEIKQLKRDYKQFTKKFKSETKIYLLDRNQNAEDDIFLTGVYCLIDFMKKYDMQLPVFPYDTFERIKNRDGLVWMDLAKLIVDSIDKEELKNLRDMNFSTLYRVTVLYLRRHSYALKIFKITDEDIKKHDTMLMIYTSLILKDECKKTLKITNENWDSFRKLTIMANAWYVSGQKDEGKKPEEIKYLFTDNFFYTHDTKRTISFE